MTVYPNNLDSNLELPSVDNNITEVGGEAINSLRSAVMALEKAIGTNPQGNLADLATRIASVIDNDGKLRTSAIEDMGLVSLPVMDKHISAQAAIAESKLDLDYSTASLNSKVVNLTANVSSSNSSITSLMGDFQKHLSATSSFRHDGYGLDISEEIRGVSTVQEALHQINNAITDHEQTTSTTHTATQISVSNEFENISATNVQNALFELDSSNASGNTARHKDVSTNAVIINKSAEVSKQGNLSDSTLSATIYQTDTTQATKILQVMHPNCARITSKNIDIRALEVGAVTTLRISAGGVNRSYLDIDLTSALPTQSLDDIIEKINSVAHNSDNHYPISAYKTKNELTIAHNMVGRSFTLSVSESSTYDASSELGFGDIVGQTFYWSGEDHGAYVDGKKIVGLKTLVSKFHTHASSSATISLGLGDLSAYDLTTGNEGRVLVNIYNHSESSTYNGTYYITSYPTSSTFALNSIILAGTFEIEILACSMNFQNSTSGKLYDIFLEYDDDGYGIVSKTQRVDYGPINGINIVDVDKNFPTGQAIWEVNDEDDITVSFGSEKGEAVRIPTDYVGQLKAYGPDNIHKMVFEITSSPANASKAAIVSDFDDEGKLYLASVLYSGNYGINGLKFVRDKRSFGGPVENTTNDEIAQKSLQEYINDLRNNGIIYGFDASFYSDTQVKLTGGRAYVEGNKIDKEDSIVAVNDTSEIQKLIVLDKFGEFKVLNQENGMTIAELTDSDSYGDNREYATITEFGFSNGAIDGYFVDRRLYVGNIDKRVKDNIARLDGRIDQLQGISSLWGTIIASDDGYVANITNSSNSEFNQVDAVGFSGGSSAITTRRFEFKSTRLVATNVFNAANTTYINVFLKASYAGLTSPDYGPFGTSGEFCVYVGAATTVGQTLPTTNEQYVLVKTVDDIVLPSATVNERYVVSIPTSLFELSDNAIFSVIPRIKITGSLYADGGTSGDLDPIINFHDVRMTLSNYSIAGNINNEDGSSTGLYSLLGDILGGESHEVEDDDNSILTIDHLLHEYHNDWSEGIQTILKDLDGYVSYVDTENHRGLSVTGIANAGTAGYFQGGASDGYGIISIAGPTAANDSSSGGIGIYTRGTGGMYGIYAQGGAKGGTAGYFQGGASDGYGIMVMGGPTAANDSSVGGIGTYTRGTGGMPGIWSFGGSKGGPGGYFQGGASDGYGIIAIGGSKGGEEDSIGGIGLYAKGIGSAPAVVTTGSIAIHEELDDNSSTTSVYLRCYSGSNTDVGGISNVAGTLQIVQESDERYKSNIQSTQLCGTNIVNNIDLIEYQLDHYLSAQPSHKIPIGFSAQNLSKVYPTAVCEVNNKLMVAPGTLIPLLIKTAQEQAREIEKLKLEIENLKNDKKVR